MKIGIVCYPTFGGSGVVATELGKALANEGHQVHFITYSQPVRLDYFSENIFYHEVSFPNYPLFEYPPYELGLASKLVDVALYENLDLFHVHYAIPHASAALLAQQILKGKGRYVPFITTLHGTDITLLGKDSTLEPVITYALSHSNGITAVSESLKQDTYRHFGVRKEIQVIPNFVNNLEYAKIREKESEMITMHRKAFAPSGEKIIVHTSNFRKVKRVEDVVLTFKGIRDGLPARLLLIGDGPERSNIEKLCRETNMCDDIKFLGKVVSPEQYLMIGDLFLLPSSTESFGLAALEAMAAGMPVVSTNTGGLPEVNLHGVTGFLTNVGDVNAMIKCSLEILGNAGLHRKMKTNALHQAAQFDISKIVPLYIQLYNTILEKAGLLS